MKQKRQVKRIIKDIDRPYFLKIVDYKPTLFLNHNDIEMIKDSYFKDMTFIIKYETTNRYYYECELVVLYPSSI